MDFEARSDGFVMLGVYDARWFGKGAVQGIHSLLFIFLPGCIAAFLAWLFSCSRLDIHSNDDAKRASPVLEVFDEDCLFLNVETPSVQGKLPVIVWIHGGGRCPSLVVPLRSRIYI